MTNLTHFACYDATRSQFQDPLWLVTCCYALKYNEIQWKFTIKMQKSDSGV